MSDAAKGRILGVALGLIGAGAALVALALTTGLR